VAVFFFFFSPTLPVTQLSNRAHYEITGGAAGTNNYPRDRGVYHIIIVWDHIIFSIVFLKIINFQRAPTTYKHRILYYIILLFEQYFRTEPLRQSPILYIMFSLGRVIYVLRTRAILIMSP